MEAIQIFLFDLPTTPTVQPKMARGATIDERCDAFIQANPHVWRTFVQIALNMKRKGVRRWSSKAIFEVMRYMATVQSVGENFKLPNEYTSRFSRKAMAEVPELADFFECRPLRTKGG
jgi:hypothetical protein